MTTRDTMNSETPNKQLRRLHGRPFIGVLKEFLADPLAFQIQPIQMTGDIIEMRVGPKLVYEINHPDHAKYVLEDNMFNYLKDPFTHAIRINTNQKLDVFSLDGDMWKQGRSLVRPAYERESVSALYATLNNLVNTSLEKWKEIAATGAPFDIAKELQDMAWESIVSISFGEGVLSRKDADTIISSYHYVIQWLENYRTSLFPLSAKVPTPANRRFHQALNAIDAIIYPLIKAGRENKLGATGWLKLFIQGGLNDQEIRDQILSNFITLQQPFFALCWTCYFLGHDLPVQQKMQFEINQRLDGREPTAVEVPNLVYTQRVFQEALRLYGGNWVITRTVAKDDVLDGIPLRANALVLVNSYGIHHNPIFWPNPEIFDPERFTPERSVGRPTYAYLPLGAGPRQCLGYHYAMMSGPLVLAKMMQNFTINLAASYPPPKADVMLGSLLPRDGIMVTLEKLPQTIKP